MAETSGGANRIELESQILCASLRQSWAINDVKGVLTVVRQLYQLFPDLLPPPMARRTPPAFTHYLTSLATYRKPQFSPVT